ncbi:MAG: hypothetical protein IH985_02525 [Planctomycetes bacterium]|nr:hypothetical protein [Planctomycetota bacterium]
MTDEPTPTDEPQRSALSDPDWHRLHRTLRGAVIEGVLFAGLIMLAVGLVLWFLAWW